MGFPVPDTGAVTEDTGIVGGKLVTNGDINFGWGSDTGQWTPATLTGAYGSQLVIDADGVWAYSANNADPTIQALNTGQTLTEVFNVNSSGGASTITITINGLDEPPCFVKGAMIETPHGPRAVETLKAGDTVLTKDSGPQNIVWIGAKPISINSFKNYNKLRPVRILKDSFGQGIPSHDILVSPMHRMLITDPAANLLFGQSEVFCPAKMLVNGTTIYRDNANETVYYHLLFENHQVITANGCESESFYPGQVGLSAFSEETREEVFSLFPDLRSLPETYGKSARYILRRYEAEVLNFELPKSQGLSHRLAKQQRTALRA